LSSERTAKRGCTRGDPAPLDEEGPFCKTPPALVGPRIPAASKFILTFGMLAGRLEIYTLILIATPVFWKR
jgi:hypothetical protein